MSLPASTLKPARRVTLATWVLRLAVAGHCLAMAWLWIRSNSPINTILYIHWGWAESTAHMVDRTAGWCFVLAAFVAVIRPTWWAMGPVAAWTFLVAWAIRADHPGDPYQQWAPVGQAARYACPVALMLLWPAVRTPLNARRSEITLWVLRVATSATFVLHGLKALWADPNFIDLIIGTGRNLVGAEISEAGATTALKVIGIVDLAVAALLVLRRWCAVAAWMAIWGLLTAASRMTAMGTEAWTETAARLANGALPLALLLLWWRCRQPGPTTPARTPDGKTSIG
ncbi:MAG: hypothetical protein OER86_08020 [Phycisphaerae bacterium]|nr:hypothetical protein [Phycisphaerae bacterium]